MSSSAPVPSDSLPGPDLPSAARGETRDAAKAFVEYWVETLNYATDTGDTRLLKALATKNCDACTAFAATLDEIYAKGGHVESKGWELKSAVPMADQPTDSPAFQLDVKFEPQKVFSTKKSKPKDYPGGEQPARMVLTRQDGRWLVEKLDI